MFNFLRRKKRVRAQEFNESSLEAALTSNPSVIIVAMTGWCGACRMQKPLVDDMAHRHAEGNAVTIGLINIDHHPAFARAHEIRSIPTTLAYHHGKLVFKKPGIMTRRELEDLYASFLR